MRKTATFLVAALLAAAPTTLSAQGFAVGARAGTLGIGAEGAVSLGSRLALRGGLGLLPFEPSTTIDDIDFTLTLPKTWFNLGADLYVGGGFRVGGGILFKSDDPELEGEITGTVEIGDETYSSAQVESLSGVLDSNDQAPYALIGFGRHTASGVGLFLDLGVAFLGEPEVGLSASGDPAIVNSSEFQAELRAEERTIEDDAGSYLKLWPILNLGVKIGLGG